MNVAFLKVHKAGSTTVQNMFLRFAKRNELNVILPRPFNYLGFDETINMQNVYPPPKNENYNILCNHVIYNKAAFYKLMPRDTVFTAIVRNPITHILSAAQFLTTLFLECLAFNGTYTTSFRLQHRFRLSRISDSSNISMTMTKIKSESKTFK
jgi:hypothetical protein